MSAVFLLNSTFGFIMGAPLTTLTEKPIQHSTFSFGGDDTKLGKSGLFGTVVEWDLNAKEDCFKANIVFFVKKAFELLDGLRIGNCCFGTSGFQGRWEECEMYQTGLERNRTARERIVAAFGGEVPCRSFRVVNLQDQNFRDYLRLDDAYFNRGESIIQGEDPAGRKFAVMRLVDAAGQVRIATIHQRYRETCIPRGSMWTTNFYGGSEMVPPNTDAAVEFIQKICARRHELTLAPKP
jgi:hypothetical protein